LPQTQEIYPSLQTGTTEANWETAMAACPSGWHLPTDAEWTTLIDHAGGISNAGKKLKARSGWDDGWDDKGTDDYGFSALPGGLGESNGRFGSIGETGFWWSASEANITANGQTAH